jgi:hypothetical protein
MPLNNPTSRGFLHGGKSENTAKSATFLGENKALNQSTQ